MQLSRTIQTILASFLSALVLFLAVTAPANAYTSTGQQALGLTDSTGLFLIEFQFGHADHDVYIPIAAQRSEGAVSDHTLSYAITDRFGEPGRGVAAGIVLGNAPIENGQYVVKKGTKATFTLFVLFTKDENASRNKYRLAVTHLPFSFDGTQKLQLNPSELQYYETPEETLE